MRWISCCLLASAAVGLALLGPLGGCAHAPHPAVEMARLFEPIPASSYHAKPYFLNLYGIALLRHGFNPGLVVDYLEWYFASLNYPDHHGLTGSIYDRDILPGGRESPLASYDSVDSYAATFLVLLRDYYVRTSDRARLERHRPRIADIAYLLVFLQDRDGLVRAVPDSDAKYLMDNCEVYAGLLAYADLAGRLGWDDPRRFREAAGHVRRAVLEELFDPQRRVFAWAKAGGRPQPSHWETFYPDALAQLFPILHGLVEPDSDLAVRLWQQFMLHHNPQTDASLSSVQRTLIELVRERMKP
jgi:hypothetical protein